MSTHLSSGNRGGFLEGDELLQVVVVERVGFPRLRGIELEEQVFASARLSRRRARRSSRRRLERALRAVEDGVEGAGFEEELAQADGGVVGVGEKGVLDHVPARPPARSLLMKCWRKRNAVSPVRIVKFCCTSGRSLPPKGVGEDDVEACLLLKSFTFSASVLV